jgi:hypothetical protein
MPGEEPKEEENQEPREHDEPLEGPAEEQEEPRKPLMDFLGWGSPELPGEQEDLADREPWIDCVPEVEPEDGIIEGPDAPGQGEHEPPSEFVKRIYHNVDYTPGRVFEDEPEEAEVPKKFPRKRPFKERKRGCSSRVADAAVWAGGVATLLSAIGLGGWAIYNHYYSADSGKGPQKDAQKYVKTDRFEAPERVLMASRRERYGLDFSPIKYYIEYEGSMSPEFNGERVENFFDNLSNHVAGLMMEMSEKGTMEEAVEELMKTQEGQASMILAMCQGLIDFDVIYHPESLLRRAFDPDMHKGDFFHMDCDLLCHTFMDMAYKFDLPMTEQLTPNHMYLLWHFLKDQTVIGVEATAFRKVDVEDVYRNGRLVGRRVNRGTSEADAEKLLMMFDEIKNRHEELTPGFFERGGYFRDMSGDEIKSSIRANILTGLHKEAEKSGDTERVGAIFQEMVKVDGEFTDSVLKTNINIIYLRGAKKAFREGRFEDAYRMADQAVGYRRANEEFLIRYTLDDLHMRGMSATNIDRWDQAVQDFREIDQWFRTKYRFRKPVAADNIHADAMVYLAAWEMSQGDRSIDVYNNFLVWAMNRKLLDGREDEQLMLAYGMSAQILEPHRPRMATSYRAKAKALSDRLSQK